MPVTAPPVFLAASFVDLVKSGVPVGVAVSGGGDSVALLHLVAACGGNIRVASVDHGLRPAAADECAMVATLCAQYGFAHQTLRWDDWNGQGNLQEKARSARYRLLANWAQDGAIADIALGHTADDQAETVLMALVRGAGVDGLAGMPLIATKHGVRFHRPLLGATRAALRDYLVDGGHAWCDDPGNLDPAYERIRLRLAAPMLGDLGLTPRALAQVASHMATAAQALDRQHDTLAAAYLLAQHGDVLVTCDLDALPREQARRMVLAAMGRVNRAMTVPRRDEQTRLMQQLRQRQASTLGGCLFSFEGPVLRVSRELAAVVDHVTPIDAVWDARWRLVGPADESLRLRALGNGIAQCPDARASGLPRASLQATPAVWRGDQLVCAPLAGFGTGWRAQIVAE